MKKNKMMRLASLLLVVTLLSTCIISGTFAKYVTADSASDTARVAKWGVTALTSGNLFGEHYVPNSATENRDQISVSAMNSVDTSVVGEKIVAPGTKNSTGLTISVTGTPEVAYKVTTSSTDSFEDIYLKAGTYAVLVKASGAVTAANVTDYYVEDPETGIFDKAAAGSYDPANTYYELHDEVTLDADYYPIEYTVRYGNLSQSFNKTEDVYDLLKRNFDTTGNANLPLDRIMFVTWEWKFNNNHDGEDTILGNLMAQPDPDYIVVSKTATFWFRVNETEYNLNSAFDITVTVEQVD